jgi:hypothetical protein
MSIHSDVVGVGESNPSPKTVVAPQLELAGMANSIRTST